MALTHQPCADTQNMEEPCLGAHLYQPFTKATCTRFMCTDLPGTARAALLASAQMAPTSVYPLEYVQDPMDGMYHRLPDPPICLAHE